ncbi:MAG TPA: DUF1360 domain-containing protein [Thermomicrobiaceae bacterium]|nr:DUF1360 domain-containing protein [Thermomicrobiaceae bacterium]
MTAGGARGCRDRRDRRESRATRLTLTGVFFGALLTFATRGLGRGKELSLRPFDLLLLGLAASRTGRVVAFERVAEPLRAPFTETVPDDSRVDETVVAEGRGVRFALGELLSCPLCVATWAAALLVYGLHLAPRPTRVFLAIMGATEVAEVTFQSTEALTWVAEAARRRAA